MDNELDSISVGLMVGKLEVQWADYSDYLKVDWRAAQMVVS